MKVFHATTLLSECFGQYFASITSFLLSYSIHATFVLVISDSDDVETMTDIWGSEKALRDYEEFSTRNLISYRFFQPFLLESSSVRGNVE